MLKINVTTKEGIIEEINTDEIEHIKIALNECEIHFSDGTSLRVKQDFEEVRRLIREEKRKRG